MKIDKKIKEKIYDRVKNILSIYPEARNDDEFLYEKYLLKYHKDELMIDMWNVYAPVRASKAGIPQFGSIVRIRAYIQNRDKLFLPTEYTVAAHRKINKDEWRMAMRPAAQAIDIS